MKTISRVLEVAVILAVVTSAVAAPERPSPARVRKSLPELCREDQARIQNPSTNDLDGVCLRADHEFLACGGEQVGNLYSQVLVLNPNHIRANLGMGEWHVAHAKYDEALPYLKKVLELAGKDSAEYAQAQQVVEFAEFKKRQKR